MVMLTYSLKVHVNNLFIKRIKPYTQQIWSKFLHQEFFVPFIIYLICVLINKLMFSLNITYLKFNLLLKIKFQICTHKIIKFQLNFTFVKF